MRHLLCFAVLVLLLAIVMLSEAGSGKDQSRWSEIEPDAAHHQAFNAETVEWGDRAATDIEHECTIHLNSPGKERLEGMLQEISDPSHPKYGKHLRKEEIDQILANPDATRDIHAYLESHGIRVLRESSTTIHAVGPLSGWEAALNTHFFAVKSSVLNDQTIYRARQYFLPESKHVVMISNTVQLPVPMRRGPVIMRKFPAAEEEQK